MKLSLSLNELASIPLPNMQYLSSSTIATPRVEWLPTHDGTLLACRRWLGQAGKPAILYLHGIEGHGQWFEHTAQILHKSGFTIYTPDRRGAGMNTEERGHLDSFKTLLLDIEQLLRHIKARHPDSPIVVFGNCWGAKPAAVICASNYKPLSGEPLPKIEALLLTCPALFTKVDLPFSQKARIGFDIAFGGKRQKREIAIPIDIEMFTDNPDFIEFIANDSLRLQAATSRFFFENFLLSLKAASAAKKLDLPVMLIQTDKDAIVNFDKVQTWFADLTSKSKVFKVFENASHSIDFDTNCFPDYVSLLVSWLNDKSVAA